MAAALAAIAGVSELSIAAQTVSFALAGSAVEQAALLLALLTAGLHVSHFAAVTEDLQQSYIKALGATRRPA